MARKKIVRSVYVTPEQDKKIRVLAEELDLPASILIRDGIDRMLDAHSIERDLLFCRAQQLIERGRTADLDLARELAAELQIVLEAALDFRRERDAVDRQNTAARQYLREMARDIAARLGDPLLNV